MQTRELRDLAWIGDAVLALYARQWLLEQSQHPLFTRQELFTRLTSNAFLQALGEPTTVEARIGNVYREGGLEAGFAYIEQHLRPLFQKHINNATRGRRGQRR
ncbi:MAG: ribonuclease III domain-containing protein [Opitutales bacterium]|jgi:dsRNA-specific ribonuclease